MAPASTSRAASRNVSAVVEEKRNQPVSVARATNAGWAIRGVSRTPNWSAASTTSRPVASASMSLNTSAPRSSPLM